MSDLPTEDRSDPGRALLYFSVLVVGAAGAVVHELVFRQLDLYVAEDSAQRTGTRLLAAATFAGAFYLGRRTSKPEARFCWILLVTSAVTAASGFAAFFGFASDVGQRLTSLLSPVLGAALVGALACTFWRSFGSLLVGLGIVVRLVTPFRLLLLFAAFGTSSIAAAQVGQMRSAIAVGLGLALAAAWSPTLLAHLDPPRAPRLRGLRPAALSLFAGELALVGLAELCVPVSMLSRYDNEIVYATESDRRTYVFTSGQRTFELFVDQRLDVSGIDERRYHEALVRPAFALTKKRQRVLLLGGGDGMAEREILEHADVERVTVVTVDAELARLARSVPWLVRRSNGAMLSERVEVVEREPIVWLTESVDIFDVAIADLPDPDGYVDGKNYTRHFYEALTERLAPDGVAVVQAVSPFNAPRTFASIVTTIESAGLAALPYRAPVPTFGEWGFVVASRGRLDPPVSASAGTFLTPDTVADMFHLPADTRAESAEPPSTLDDQRVVATFEAERSGL